jgi:hypothetical protein
MFAFLDETFEIRRFVVGLIRPLPAQPCHAAFGKRQAFFAVEIRAFGSHRSVEHKTRRQNLNKLSQIMVSAICGQGGLSCTERTNYEDTHNVEPVPGDGGISEPL